MWILLGGVQLFATPAHARLPCPWGLPGKNTEAGWHFLLQGIFLIRDGTHVSCVSCTGRQILYHCTIWASPINTKSSIPPPIFLRTHSLKWIHPFLVSEKQNCSVQWKKKKKLSVSNWRKFWSISGLVCKDCCNKMPQTGWLKRQKWIFSCFLILYIRSRCYMVAVWGNLSPPAADDTFSLSPC